VINIKSVQNKKNNILFKKKCKEKKEKLKNYYKKIKIRKKNGDI